MEENSTYSESHSSKFSSTLIIVAGTIFLIWYLQFLWKRRYLYIYASKIPGPLALPLIGSTYAFVGNNVDIFGKIVKWNKQYPKIIKIWFGPELFIGISDPKFVETVLTRCLKKSSDYSHFEPITERGLIIAPVDTWRKHRRSLVATFNQKILDGFVNQFTATAHVLTDLMEKFDGKGEFDVNHLLSNFFLDSICETIMGAQVNAQTSNSPLPKWFELVNSIAFQRLYSLWYRSDVIFNRSKLFSVMVKNANKIKTFTDEVVSEKRQAYEEKKRQILMHGEEYDEQASKRKVLLDHIIEIADKEKDCFTPKEIRDEVTTFIIAGSETSATSMCFTLLLLGMYPDIQAKLLEEVLDLIGPDRDPEYSDLPHLKYTEMVIKESLRLFPSLPLVGRSIEEDIDLGEYTIPKGCSIGFSIMSMHTNEKYWPDPYKFIPERFLPEEVAKRHPCTYVPFSYGPRNCIGLRYAMMSLKTTLAMIVRKFRIHTSYKSIEEIKLECNLILNPIDGFKVSLELR